MPSGKPQNHIEVLDILRGVAIFWVFLFHCVGGGFHFSSLQWDGWFRDFHTSSWLAALLPLELGWAGVAIFFVVSGFCIHLSFHKGGRDWGGFFTRRFFRLYPAYLLALLLFVFLFPPTRTALVGLSGHDFREQLLSHLFLVHNFGGETFYGINASFWSIAVEVQLYLLYPVLLWLVHRFGWRRTLCMIGGCEILIRAAEGVTASMGAAVYTFNFKIPAVMFQVTPYVHGLDASPLGYWFSWALGAWLADAYLKGEPLPLARTSVPLWASLFLLSYFIRPFLSFFFLLAAISTAVVMSRILAGEPLKWRLPQFVLGHLRQTGVWSYSIYLVHQPLVMLAGKIPEYFRAGAPTPPEWKFAVCLLSWAVIMPLGGICYRYCELPSIAMGKWVMDRAMDWKKTA